MLNNAVLRNDEVCIRILESADSWIAADTPTFHHIVKKCVLLYSRKPFFLREISGEELGTLTDTRMSMWQMQNQESRSYQKLNVLKATNHLVMERNVLILPSFSSKSKVGMKYFASFDNGKIDLHVRGEFIGPYAQSVYPPLTYGRYGFAVEVMQAQKRVDRACLAIRRYFALGQPVVSAYSDLLQPVSEEEHKVRLEVNAAIKRTEELERLKHEEMLKEIQKNPFATREELIEIQRNKFELTATRLVGRGVLEATSTETSRLRIQRDIIIAKYGYNCLPYIKDCWTFLAGQEYVYHDGIWMSGIGHACRAFGSAVSGLFSVMYLAAAKAVTYGYRPSIMPPWDLYHLMREREPSADIATESNDYFDFSIFSDVKGIHVHNFLDIMIPFSIHTKKFEEIRMAWLWVDNDTERYRILPESMNRHRHLRVFAKLFDSEKLDTMTRNAADLREIANTPLLRSEYKIVGKDSSDIPLFTTIMHSEVTFGYPLGIWVENEGLHIRYRDIIEQLKSQPLEILDLIFRHVELPSISLKGSQLFALYSLHFYFPRYVRRIGEFVFEIDQKFVELLHDSGIRLNAPDCTKLDRRFTKHVSQTPFETTTASLAAMVAAISSPSTKTISLDLTDTQRSLVVHAAAQIYNENRYISLGNRCGVCKGCETANSLVSQRRTFLARISHCTKTYSPMRDIVIAGESGTGKFRTAVALAYVLATDKTAVVVIAKDIEYAYREIHRLGIIPFSEQAPQPGSVTIYTDPNDPMLSDSCEHRIIVSEIELSVEFSMTGAYRIYVGSHNVLSRSRALQFELSKIGDYATRCRMHVGAMLYFDVCPIVVVSSFARIRELMFYTRLRFVHERFEDNRVTYVYLKDLHKYKDFGIQEYIEYECSCPESAVSTPLSRNGTIFSIVLQL